MEHMDQQLVEAVEAALARHKMPGASVAILKEGKLSLAAAGVINVSTGVELTTDTVMHIGSIAKLFNATLVMQLVDDGMIDLDDCILEYLPDLDWDDPKAAAAITVRMLLNHTSGMNGAMIRDEGPDEETLEKGVQRWARLGQLFPPGAEFSYCNPATAIAGYIAQRLRRASWSSLVRERIFEPLEMRHAVALPQDALLYRAGVGHFLDPAHPTRLVRTSHALLPLSYGPSGTTVMMSAADLITFAGAHVNGGVGANGARILSEHSTLAMQTGTVKNKDKGYAKLDLGLGWMRFSDGLLNHNGGAPGVMSSLFAHPGAGFAVAVLTNGEHGRAVVDDIVGPALDGISEESVTSTFSEEDAVKPLVRPPAAYAGLYEDILTTYRVREEGGRLLLSARQKSRYYDSISTEETPAALLEHIGDDKFLWRAPAEIAGSEKAWARLFAFRGTRPDGRMERIGNKMLLYKNMSA